MRRRKENAAVRWIKDVAALIRLNKKIALIVLAFVVVVIVGIVIASKISGKEEVDDGVAVVIEDIPEDEYTITDEPLQVDAIPEINSMMARYYAAAANGDVETIKSIRTNVDDTLTTVIQKKSEYVESYPVVTCYTKPGPVENSYMCLAYYEVKLYDYEQCVPGVNAWYVCIADDGTYYINDDEQDEKLTNYCKAISVQDDYIDLTNTVNVKFNEAVSADAKLASFLEKLPDLLTTAVGEELAKAQEPEVTPEPEQETETENVQISDTTQKKAKTTDVVNVRESDSENADRLGKAQKGDSLTVVEQKINGWSKVIFEGKEGYIKSEFLEIVGEADGTSNTSTQVSDEEAIAKSPSSGKARAKDTVNIRKSASTDAEKIAMAYQGEEMTVVEKQSDGWTKVKYNGKTGFVKSEYLE